jgi:transcriptional regulator with XRE-family HTH domain
MTTESKNQSLGDFVRARRESRGLDYYEAEQASGLDHTFWRKLEAGQYESPGPKSLEAIAQALQVPLEDLYALAGYEVGVRLPSLKPYLRARYHLPHQAVAELERYFQLLRNYYDIPDDRPVFPPKPQRRKAPEGPPEAKRRAA